MVEGRCCDTKLGFLDAHPSSCICSSRIFSRNETKEIWRRKDHAVGHPLLKLLGSAHVNSLRIRMLARCYGLSATNIQLQNGLAPALLHAAVTSREIVENCREETMPYHRSKRYGHADRTASTLRSVTSCYTGPAAFQCVEQFQAGVEEVEKLH